MTEDTLTVTDLDHFVRLLSRWHMNVLRILRHLQEAPSGLEIEVQGEPKILQGDLRLGFQLGLHVALSQIQELPFVAEMEDATIATKH